MSQPPSSPEPLPSPADPLPTPATPASTTPPVAAPAGSVRARWRLPARIFLAAVGIYCAVLILTRPNPSPLPVHSRINLGDHVSHIGSTLLFLDAGFQVFTKTQQALCTRPLGPREARQTYDRIHFPGFVQSEYCGVTSTPRAFHINWIDIVKPYPVGLYGYTLPEALLFRAGVTEQTLISVSLLKYLLAALALCWLLVQVYAGAGGPRVLRFLGWLLLTVLILHWSLHGIYDSIAVLFAVAGMAYLERGPKHGAEHGPKHGGSRLLASWTCLSLAVFMHYRMLLFLPVLLWVTWRVVQEQLAGTRIAAWANRLSGPRLALFRSIAAQTSPAPVTRGARVAFIAIALLNLFNLAIMVKHFPAFSALPDNSALRLSANAWGLGLTLGAWTVLSLIRRKYLWAITVAWSGLFLFATHQMMPWHWLSLIPFVALARLPRHTVWEFLGAHVYLILAFALLYREAPIDLVGIFRP